MTDLNDQICNIFANPFIKKQNSEPYVYCAY